MTCEKRPRRRGHFNWRTSDRRWLFALLASTSLFCGCAYRTPKPSSAPALFAIAMPVLPIMQPTSRAGDVTVYDLNVQKGRTKFLPDTEADETYGYNGSLLGPTLRLRQGEEVVVRIHNDLDGGQVTNVHWHGMRIPASADGPHNDILPGQSFTARFTVAQPAATLWYHPHWGNSGFQVYKGLAGLLYVEDKNSDTLPIPREYGVDDFPVVVQDKSFYPDGRLAYMTHPDEEDRMLGDRIFVNGAANPYLELPRAMVRLRLLNASNARRYNFAFEDGRTFYLIASDGGFLAAPAPITNIFLAAAERAEILVDLAQDALGTRVKLVSRSFQVWKNERGPMVLVNGRPQLSPNAVGNAFPVMELRVTRPGALSSIPERLVRLDPIREATARITRTFRLNDNGKPTINGQRFNMNRTDLEVKSGATEIWKVINDDEKFPHSFHIHGIQVMVLDRSSHAMPVNLPPLETGWKDTVIVSPGETIRLIGRFDGLAGLYMFHCHVLEHEDLGMMGTFFVAPPGHSRILHPAHRE